MNFSPINSETRGSVTHSYSSNWLKENEKTKYYNRVVHLAKVNLKFLLRDGYTDFKIRHYPLDMDEFEDGVDVFIIGSEVEYF